MRGPHVVTVRNCSVAQSCLCVVSTAAVCTYLAVDSGQRAVLKVKEAGSDSVENCFEAGSDGVDSCFTTAKDNIKRMTGEVLRNLGTRAEAYMRDFARQPRVLVQEFAEYLASWHPNQTTDWEWQREVLSPWMQAKHKQLQPLGLHMLGLVTAKEQMRLLMEAESTLGAPYDTFPSERPMKYHHVTLIANNGSDYGAACDRSGPCPFVVAKLAGEDLGAEWEDADGGVRLRGLRAGDNPAGRWAPLWAMAQAGGENYAGRTLLRVNGVAVSTAAQITAVAAPLTDLTLTFGGGGECCRTFDGDIEEYGGDFVAGDGGLVSGAKVCETSQWPMTKPPGLFTPVGVKTRGAEKGGPCPVPGVDPAGLPVVLPAKMGIPMRGRVGEPRWLPVTATSSYVSLPIVTAYTHPDVDPAAAWPGGKMGAIWATTELSHVQEFMRGVRVGESRFRMFAAVASDWVHHLTAGTPFEEPDTSYLLAGASHGSSVLMDWEYDSITQRRQLVAAPLHDVNATDPVIRSIARFARSAAEQHTGADGATGYGTCCRGVDALLTALGKPELGGVTCPRVNNSYHDTDTARPCSPELPVGGADGYEVISRAVEGYMAVPVQWACVDDEEGKVNEYGGSCQQAAADCASFRAGLVGRGKLESYCCDYDLSTGLQPQVGGAPISDRVFFPAGTTIADQCRVTCGTCGARDLPTGEEDFFVRVRRFDDGFGLDVWIVVAIDRAYILGEVDRTSAAVEYDIQETRAGVDRQIRETNVAVDREREEGTQLVVAVALGLVAFLVVCSAAFAHAIVSPIRLLGDQMTDVATLHLSELDLIAPYSALAEVRRMEQGFRKMVWAMKQYRSYLPQTCVLDNVEEDDDSVAALLSSNAIPVGDESQSGRSTVEHSRAVQSVSHMGSDGAICLQVSLASRGRRFSPRRQVDNMTVQRVDALQAHLSKAVGGGISKRKVTFCASGFRHWHAHFVRVADGDMCVAHSEMLSAMLPVFAHCKGVPDIFSGDRILVCFNSARPLPAHRSAACTAALCLVGMSERWAEAAGESEASVPRAAARTTPSVSFGISCGDTKHGNMGCDGMKRYSHMSTSVTFACAAERYSTKVCCGGLIDQQVQEEAEHTFALRLVDRLVMLKRAARPCPVYMLVEQRKPAAEVLTPRRSEWMYRLCQQGTADQYSQWNDAMHAVAQQQWDPARQLAVQLGGALPAPPAAVPSSPGGVCVAAASGIVCPTSPAALRRACPASCPAPTKGVNGGHERPTRSSFIPAAAVHSPAVAQIRNGDGPAETSHTAANGTSHLPAGSPGMLLVRPDGSPGMVLGASAALDLSRMPTAPLSTTASVHVVGMVATDASHAVLPRAAIKAQPTNSPPVSPRSPMAAPARADLPPALVPLGSPRSAASPRSPMRSPRSPAMSFTRAGTYLGKSGVAVAVAKIASGKQQRNSGRSRSPPKNAQKGQWPWAKAHPTGRRLSPSSAGSSAPPVPGKNDSYDFLLRRLQQMVAEQTVWSPIMVDWH